MAVVAKQRIEPKVLAALVNRFTSDTAEFLTNFASQAEAKLLHLSQRLERLERLVALFEQKVHHLEPATTGGPPVQVQAAKEQVQEAAPEAAGTGPTQTVTHAEPQVAPSPPAEDEKYAMYRRMHRTGVPLLAIRQKLLLDALQDPTLDVAVLDTFDGAAGTGAGAPAPKVPTVVAKAPEAAAPPAPAPAEPETEELEPTTEQPPAPLPEPSPSGGPINLAAAAAAMAQRRMSRVAAKAEANPEPKSEVKKAPAPAFSAPSKAPMPVPKAMHKEEPAASTVASAPAMANPTLFATDDTTAKGFLTSLVKPMATAKAPIAKVEEPAAPLGLFAATDDTAPKARLPPPPPKAKASTAMSPEAALKLRRSVVAQVRDDDAQSDVSDF